MSSIIEEDTNAVVGELVTKSVLVGIIHPLAHPNKMFMASQGSRVRLGWTMNKRYLLIQEKLLVLDQIILFKGLY